LIEYEASPLVPKRFKSTALPADIALALWQNSPNKDSLMSMSDENLKDDIKEMMVESLMLKTPKEEISDNMPLFGPEGLGLDSIDALELVVSLEKRYGVSVSNSEVAKHALASVNTIYDYVVANRKRKSEAA
jgi:acyl carrier protein